MFNLFKSKKEMITLQRVRPVFITVDGVEHLGVMYNWAITNRLACSVPKYLMIEIKSDGYVRDMYDVMYPLANIISIDWKLVEERTMPDKFSEYKIFVTDEELEYESN